MLQFKKKETDAFKISGSPKFAVMDIMHSTMSDKLRTMLKRLPDLDKVEPNKVHGNFYRKHVAKSTILLQAGSTCKELYFVQKGCLSSYFVDKDGFIKVRSIMLDGDVGTALTSFVAQRPSIEFLEALEDTDL